MKEGVRDEQHDEKLENLDNFRRLRRRVASRIVIETEKER